MAIALTDIRPHISDAPAAPHPVSPSRSHIRAVPAEPEARGFVLYVGLGEESQELDGIDLATLVRELRELTGRLSPSAQTHAAVALAPADAGGRDIDVVRRALQDPSLRTPEPEDEPETDLGVTIDFGRNRVAIDGEQATLTYKEFELLQSIVLRTGRAVERQELIDIVWRDTDAAERPNARTVDVHIRRLRAKLGDYADIIRTVRGSGYRYDGRSDVRIVSSLTRSPDIF
ncbi:MAG TPA: winged helix-turn-helix domain-containing protein [Candidatus Agrococcus pullicola]|uniref:Winged helix-turn-helix domain-containing protein n=1 Tax=Candidatus Agrococcus pullicola TaxID=2838429 RepID=A0A9D1YT82_9MICO|nr:winged helix-turn-helix domain-containing protein [Candidatus Agrococcus pullicola]